MKEKGGRASGDPSLGRESLPALRLLRRPCRRLLVVVGARAVVVLRTCRFFLGALFFVLFVLVEAAARAARPQDGLDERGAELDLGVGGDGGDGGFLDVVLDNVRGHDDLPAAAAAGVGELLAAEAREVATEREFVRREAPQLRRRLALHVRVEGPALRVDHDRHHVPPLEHEPRALLRRRCSGSRGDVARAEQGAVVADVQRRAQRLLGLDRPRRSAGPPGRRRRRRHRGGEADQRAGARRRRRAVELDFQKYGVLAEHGVGAKREGPRRQLQRDGGAGLDLQESRPARRIGPRLGDGAVPGRHAAVADARVAIVANAAAPAAVPRLAARAPLPHRIVTVQLVATGAPQRRHRPPRDALEV
mmetsp:Transcript_2877/g.8655  ORF Transcript_2877/g.8655 Transcript_2877/m.8655 type:complete len:362 (-) Transcript_2877:774-1859(-)